MGRRGRRRWAWLATLWAVVVVDAAVGTTTVAASSPPVITIEPNDIVGYPGTFSTGTTTATMSSPSGTPTGVWEHSDDGLSWTSAGTASLTNLGGGLFRSQRLVFFSSAKPWQRGVFTNGSGSVTTQTFQVVVLTPAAPTIAQDPQPAAAHPGSNVTLTAKADAADPVSVTWERSDDDGDTWASAGTGSVTRLAAEARYAQTSKTITVGNDTVGLYRATFTNSLGSATTAPAEVSQLSGTAPVIDQPLTDAVAVLASSGTVELAVGFSGTVSGVQWQWEPYPSGATTTLSGTTTGPSGATLAIGRQQRIDRIYTVRVSGPYGEATSSARVTVGTAPAVTDPLDRAAAAGTDATFTASLSGGPAYPRWERSDDAGQTWTTVSTGSSDVGAKTHVEPAVGLGDDGAQFRLVADSPLGTATSQPATLAVVDEIPAPAFTATPPATAVLTPDDTTLSATASSYNVAYTWWAENPCPYLNGPQGYLCIGWNRWPSSFASGATVDLGPSGIVEECVPRRLRVVAANETGSDTYEFWARRESAPPVATTAPPAVQHFIPGVRMIPAAGGASCATAGTWERQTGPDSWAPLALTGNYVTLDADDDGLVVRRVWTNDIGSTPSAPITLRMAPTVALTTQPQPAVGPVGSTVVFDAGAPVDGLTYRWESRATPTSSFIPITDGATASGATTTSLSWVVGPSDSGREFRLRVQGTHRDEDRNETITVFSTIVPLSIGAMPQFVEHPAATSAAPKTTATFTVEVAGDPSPTIRWERSTDGSTWSTIADATGPTLEVAVNVAIPAGTRYRAVATSPWGEVASDPALLTVLGLQRITFPALPVSPEAGTTVLLDATSDAGLPISYAATGACTLDGDLLTFTDPGRTCTVTADQPGDVLHAPAKTVARKAKVAKADQTIDFGPLPISPAVGTRTTLDATSSSGLTVRYHASGGCSIKGRTVTWTIAGELCTITAVQNGSTTYLPAAPVARSTTPVMGEQRLTLTGLPTWLVPGSTLPVKATATSRLPITLEAGGACSLGPITVTATATVALLTVDGLGTCTLHASQPGDDSWSAAEPIDRARTIKAPQTIDFAPLPAELPVGTYDLDATASSGLTVTFTATGGCTVRKAVLTLATVGEPCSIRARQSGNATYRPAPPVIQTVIPT